MPKTIMIVDDSETFRDKMKSLLGSKFQYLEAADGMAALAIAKQNPHIDLVLCDFNMPVLNGLRTAENFKTIPGMKEKPFLMLTTEAGESFRNEGRKIGIRGWLMKPVTENTISAINKLLGE